MGRTIAIWLCVVAVLVVIYLTTSNRFFHYRIGHRDLSPAMARGEFAKIAGQGLASDLVVIRAFGVAEFQWYEMRIPPQRVSELEAALRKVADDRDATQFIFTRGPTGEREVLGMPNPDWFVQANLPQPTRTFCVSSKWSPGYWLSVSDRDGRILMSMTTP